MKRLTEKLTSKAGFTLAEELISVIFVGLLCIAIGTGLAAAMGASSSISEIANAQQLLSRASQVVNDELSFALSVETDSSGAVTYVSETTRTEVQLVTIRKGSAAQGIGLTGDDISQGTDTPGEILLVPESNGLVAVVSNVSYTASGKLWSCDLDIQKSGDTSGQPLASISMQVKRVGN